MKPGKRALAISTVDEVFTKYDLELMIRVLENHAGLFDRYVFPRQQMASTRKCIRMLKNTLDKLENRKARVSQS